MLNIKCTGSPYQIGFTHGKEAAELVKGTIKFYAALFEETATMKWPQVLTFARDLEGWIKKQWPRFYEEMQGVADGAVVSISDVIAINVRTEIMFGLSSDGCTSLGWTSEEKKTTFLGQNWDWRPGQAEHLILLNITQPEIPQIQMVTEAGLIGKIGFNAAGVGVCFNAIRSAGVDTSRMPVHLGLRSALECTSAKAAVAAIQEHGMAAAASILIADKSTCVCVEFTSKTVIVLPADMHGRVYHSNHLLGEHGASEPHRSVDTTDRFARIKELAGPLSPSSTLAQFYEIFKDEQGYPAAICRASYSVRENASLFTIAMDLSMRCAIVTKGRPCAPEETYQLQLKAF